LGKKKKQKNPGQEGIMDDDIAALQALLGAVQKQESKNRLNERNCRELLVKLIEKELVKVMFLLILPGSEIQACAVPLCTRAASHD
jgi:hypothetical protein